MSLFHTSRTIKGLERAIGSDGTDFQHHGHVERGLDRLLMVVQKRFEVIKHFKQYGPTAVEFLNASSVVNLGRVFGWEWLPDDDVY